MTAVKKFLFDRDFDAPVEPVEASSASEPAAVTEPPVPTFSEEDVLAAQQRGYAEGRDDGVREAAEATERDIADALAGMPDKLQALFQLQEDANRSIAQETLAVATAIAKKAFPDLNARNALGEIERMVRDVLESVIDEPRVQIFVAPALRDPLSERLATIAERVGYDGRIGVAADKAMKRGDCRVEWNNGGAQRNLETLWTQIDEIVERNLGEDAPRGPREPEPETEATGDATPPAEESAEAAVEAAAEPVEPPSPVDAADTEPAGDASESTADSAPAPAEPEPEAATEAAVAAAPETAAADVRDLPEPALDAAEPAPDVVDDVAPDDATADEASPEDAPASGDAPETDIVDEPPTQEDETPSAPSDTTEQDDR